jgi:CDP-paratose 2-epimerase
MLILSIIFRRWLARPLPTKPQIPARSEMNRAALESLGVRVVDGDVRIISDLESSPEAWRVIDAAANPNVMASVDGRTSSRQLMEHNLIGTLNVLEYCNRWQAGMLLLSTSRVCSTTAPASLPMKVSGSSFDTERELPLGARPCGISKDFSMAQQAFRWEPALKLDSILDEIASHVEGHPDWLRGCGVA